MARRNAVYVTGTGRTCACYWQNVLQNKASFTLTRIFGTWEWLYRLIWSPVHSVRRLLIKLCLYLVWSKNISRDWIRTVSRIFIKDTLDLTSNTAFRHGLRRSWKTSYCWRMFSVEPPSWFMDYITLSLIHIWRCRRSTLCRSRWSPYH